MLRDFIFTRCFSRAITVGATLLSPFSFKPYGIKTLKFKTYLGQHLICLIAS